MTAMQDLEGRVTSLERSVRDITSGSNNNTSLTMAAFADIRQQLDYLRADVRNHDDRFDQADGRFDQVDSQLDQLDARLSKIEKELDNQKQRTEEGFSFLGTTIENFRAATNERFDRLETDISSLKTDMSEVKGSISGLEQDVSGLKQDVSGLKQNVSGLEQDVSGLKQDVSQLKEGMAEVLQILRTKE